MTTRLVGMETPEEFVRRHNETVEKRLAARDAQWAAHEEGLLDAAAACVINRGEDCDRVVAEKIRALLGKPCRCGSGAHPRRCERHPRAFDRHVEELNREAKIDEEADTLRAEVAALREALGEMRRYPTSQAAFARIGALLATGQPPAVEGGAVAEAVLCAVCGYLFVADDAICTQCGAAPSTT